MRVSSRVPRWLPVVCLCTLLGLTTLVVRAQGQSAAAAPAAADRLISQAQELLQAGRLEEAEPLLARAAKLDPSAQAIRLEWASVLDRLHRYQEAEAALAGVPPPAPTGQRLAYYRLKASINLGAGNAKSAALDMEQALRLAPDDQNLTLATGMAEIEARDWTRATSHLAPVFAATHSPVAGLALLRAQLAAHRDYKATLQELRSIDLPAGQKVPFEVQLGETLAQGGVEAEAVREFEEAAQAAPDHADLYFDLALAQFRAGQLDAALESAQKAKSLGDSASVESLMGDVQEARGDSLSAVHSYQAAVALDPNQESYRLTLGLELLRHGTFEPALAVFQQAAGIFPKSSRVRVAVGLTHYFLEQYPEAIQALVEAAQLDPASELAPEYLGEIQLQQPVTPVPAAIDLVCRYADQHPDRAGILAYCAALQLRVEHDRGDAGPSANVMERLRLAARRAPSNATAPCALGKALEWSRQWQPAETEMQECLRLNPDSIEAHYRLANIARHLGQTQLAEKEVQLHDQAQQHLVESNALRDRTLQKFLYTMSGSNPKAPNQP